MKRPSLAAIAFLALVAGALLVTATTAPQIEEGVTSGSASVLDRGTGGAGSLRAYLDEMGARTTLLEGDAYAPAGAGVIFVLAPSEPFDASDVAALREAASAGATVVLAVDRLGSFRAQPLIDVTGAGLGGLARAGRHRSASPLLVDPPVRAIEVDIARELVLDGARPLTEGEHPIAAYRTEGAGRFVIVGAVDPFLGSGLGRADNARFALALAAPAIRAGKAVAFDEYHHGLRGRSDPYVLLTRTWPGRALVIGAVLTLVWLAWSGRRLGPPLPLDPRPPRSSLEYVRGLAALARRAGRDEIVRERLRRDLRTGLVREIGLDPAAPFDRIAETLAVRDPGRAARARALDARLSGRLGPYALLESAAEMRRVVTGGSG